jgi:transposase
MQWTMAIGVDTHKEVHVAVALDALGAQLDSREIATTPAGYQSLLSLGAGARRARVRRRGHRQLRRSGSSASSSKPASACTSASARAGQERRRGKSDLIEAALAARRLLGGERLSLPRGAGRREDLRLLLLERG